MGLEWPVVGWVQRGGSVTRLTCVQQGEGRGVNKLLYVFAVCIHQRIFVLLNIQRPHGLDLEAVVDFITLVSYLTERRSDVDSCKIPRRHM